MSQKHFLITPPAAGEYNPYYDEYIRRVPEGDVLAFLEIQLSHTIDTLRGLSEEQANACPAPGEWNIKQIIGHLSDTERIFAYRALRIARGDMSPLPGFAQNPRVGIISRHDECTPKQRCGRTHSQKNSRDIP